MYLARAVGVVQFIHVTRYWEKFCTSTKTKFARFNSQRYRRYVTNFRNPDRSGTRDTGGEMCRFGFCRSYALNGTAREQQGRTYANRFCFRNSAKRLTEFFDFRSNRFSKNQTPLSNRGLRARS